VAKLNPAGSALLYSLIIGGHGADTSKDIAVDGAGNAYITGYTDSTDFPTTNGAFQPMPGGSFEAFVAKIEDSESEDIEDPEGEDTEDDG
jgi:hypothetical protein